MLLDDELESSHGLQASRKIAGLHRKLEAKHVTTVDMSDDFPSDRQQPFVVESARANKRTRGSCRILRCCPSTNVMASDGMASVVCALLSIADGSDR